MSMNTENLKLAFMNIISPATTHKAEECIEKIFELKGEKDQDDNTVISYDNSVSIGSTLNYFLSNASIGEGIEWDVKDCTGSFSYDEFNYGDEVIEAKGVRITDNEGTALNCVVIYDDTEGIIYKVFVFDYEYFDSMLAKIANMAFPSKKKGYANLSCAREIESVVLNITNDDGTPISVDNITAIITDALSIENHRSIDDYMEQFKLSMKTDCMEFSVVEGITCESQAVRSTVTTSITNDTQEDIGFNAILLFSSGHFYTIYAFDETELIEVKEPYIITARTKDEELLSNATIAIMEADENFNDIKEELLYIGTASSYHTFLDRLHSILDKHKYEILETRSFKEFKATNGVNTVFELTNGKIEEEKQSDYTDVMFKCCHNIDIGFDSGVLPDNIRTQLIMIAPIAKTEEEE